MFIFIDLSNIKRIIIILIIILIILGAYWLGIYVPDKDMAVTSAHINNPNEEELKKIAQGIFDTRNKAVLDDVELIQDLFARELTKGSWAYEEEIRKIKYLNQWSEKQSVEFKNIDSKVFLRSVKEVQNGYQLGLAVTTEYIYAYKNQDIIENTFSMGTYHSLDIIRKNGRWVITREWYEDPFINSSDLVEVDMESTNKIISSKEKKDLSHIGDKREKAIKYADAYCGVARPPEYSFQYNLDYKNYNSSGGNCTNFISQVIHEAGMDKTVAWNYNSGGGSKAWVNAHAFSNYMLYSGRGSLIASGTYEEVLESSYQLLPGDYISYERKGEVAHNAVVTGVDSKGYILVNTNTPDYYRVPWDLGWSNEDIRFWLVRVNY